MSKSYMYEVAKMLGVELGEEFYIDGSSLLFKFDDEGVLQQDGDDWYGCEVLSGLLNGQLTIRKKPWKPKYSDVYFYANKDKDLGRYTVNDMWTNRVFDLEHYALGNCFKTQKEAEANADRIISRLKAIYEDGKPLNLE